MLTPQNPGRHPTNKQLSLIERPASSSLPLRVALQQVAHQWSRRLDQPIRVADHGWRGYRIEPDRRAT